MEEQASEVCNEHAAGPEFKSSKCVERPNIFRAILNSRLPEQEKSQHRMAHEGLEVFLAGSITFSRAMTCAMFHILDQPLLKEALCQELRRLMPDPAVIPEVRALAQSPYLNAVIKEALRLEHTVTFRTPLVARTEDLSYEGRSLPAGTIISMTLAYGMMDADV